MKLFDDILENKVTRKIFPLMLTFWLSMLSLSFYFTMNILNFDKKGGVCLIFLVLPFFVFLFQFLILLFKTKKDNIFINNSFLFIIFIFIYITSGIILDRNDILYFKSFWFSTTGGCLIFFALGSFIAFVYNKIIYYSSRLNVLRKLNDFFIKYYGLFTCLLYAFTLLSLWPRGRTDLFLVNTFGFYQRVGNFMVLNTILMSYCYSTVINNKNNNYAINIYYLFYIIISSVLAQFVGSNNAFVAILGIFFVSIVYKIFIIGELKKHRFIAIKKWFKSEIKLSIINSFIRVFVKRILLYTFLIVVFLLAFSRYLPPLRIFGFNKINNYNPLEKRINIVKNNFIEQFSVNPIWGDMNADVLTTGTGTYPHSFFLSIMTHCGVVGCFLFIMYFICALCEFYRQMRREKNYSVFFQNLFLFLILSFIFIMANISTFMSWNPIWFSLGFCFPVVAVKNKALE